MNNDHQIWSCLIIITGKDETFWFIWSRIDLFDESMEFSYRYEILDSLESFVYVNHSLWSTIHRRIFRLVFRFENIVVYSLLDHHKYDIQKVFHLRLIEVYRLSSEQFRSMKKTQQIIFLFFHHEKRIQILRKNWIVEEMVKALLDDLHETHRSTNNRR